jgi:hypothetical protein
VWCALFLSRNARARDERDENESGEISVVAHVRTESTAPPRCSGGSTGHGRETSRTR